MQNSRRFWKCLGLSVLIYCFVTLTSSTMQQDCINKPCEPDTAVADPWNDRIALQVAADGRFNIGAFPDPLTGGTTTGSWDLTYRWPSTPWTSYTTLRIDGVNHRYGETPISTPVDVTPTQNQSAWVIGDLHVTQHLQIIDNPQTGEQDLVLIRYEVQNTSTTTAHDLATRIMFDTEISGNDGAPFRVPGVGIFTTEHEFLGDDIPQNFQVFYAISDSQHVASASLYFTEETRPDRLVIARWPNLYGDTFAFDYTIDPSAVITNDSAYAVYWNPRSIAPGTTQNFVTYYGLGEFDVDLTPPLALGLSGPAHLFLNTIDGTYTPNPFDVVATVFNNGTATATGVQLTLSLPPGLTLAFGSPSLTIGDLLVGQERQINWSVRAVPQPVETTLSYFVVANATNTTAKTVSRDILLPAAPHSTSPPPPCFATAANQPVRFRVTPDLSDFSWLFFVTKAGFVIRAKTGNDPRLLPEGEQVAIRALEWAGIEQETDLQGNPVTVTWLRVEVRPASGDPRIGFMSLRASNDNADLLTLGCSERSLPGYPPPPPPPPTPVPAQYIWYVTCHNLTGPLRVRHQPDKSTPYFAELTRGSDVVRVDLTTEIRSGNLTFIPIYWPRGTANEIAYIAIRDQQLPQDGDYVTPIRDLSCPAATSTPVPTAPPLPTPEPDPTILRYKPGPRWEDGSFGPLFGLGQTIAVVGICGLHDSSNCNAPGATIDLMPANVEQCVDATANCNPQQAYGGPIPVFALFKGCILPGSGANSVNIALNCEREKVWADPTSNTTFSARREVYIAHVRLATGLQPWSGVNPNDLIGYVDNVLDLPHAAIGLRFYSNSGGGRVYKAQGTELLGVLTAAGGCVVDDWMNTYNGQRWDALPPNDPALSRRLQACPLN